MLTDVSGLRSSHCTTMFIDTSPEALERKGEHADKLDMGHKRMG
jgi:hypothetical protein